MGAKLKRMRGRQFVARARSLPTRTILTPLTRQSRTLDTTPPNTPATPFVTGHTNASSGAMAAPLGAKPVFKTRGKRKITFQAWLPSVQPVTAAGATPKGGWPSPVPPWLRPSPRPSHALWASAGLGGQPGQGAAGANGIHGAIRLGKIAPHSGDLVASPAQANGGH